ncbi:bifunctional DNA-formamidopyrimidine glycosylase/DNA-(apurinic or apyrimidinic site) lyase [Anaeromyxobacter paludicola]|uniref:Formamidopyrimidine-DNA glycosylase n=1 Tax=Anaeromyxobacter paludicola TaxID=2918171 RepID=A0ABN6NAT0_9BACT|nr:bifunctional DNA-formamidopyrimidine glycosylase/DNA-(apurinic or apyrimidinic site) lyase [Anaeromyxobacter paludicola]BDG09460.1 formamidopyrimidine-DNA glycosylase [Anaeromyxobacter paludicola]
MPELPEVEIAARNLRRWTRGRRIEAVETDPRAARVFRPGAPEAFAAALAGRRITRVDRHGKQLLLTLDAAAKAGPLGVLAHLGMTGKWLRRRPGEEPPSHSRARLRLDTGAVLHFRDPRLFGRLRLVPGARFDAVPELSALGPDPLRDGVDPAALGAALSRSRRPVKVALLDQSLLAGVGNIYASEALFRARIDPRRAARDLTPAEVRRLAGAVVAAMEESLRRQEGPEITYVEEPGAENPFLVYGKAGEPCPRCRRARIVRAVQAQRSTFYCPRCQR